jgi:hypothetical protein
MGHMSFCRRSEGEAILTLVRNDRLTTDDFEILVIAQK